MLGNGGRTSLKSKIDLPLATHTTTSEKAQRLNMKLRNLQSPTTFTSTEVIAIVVFNLEVPNNL